MRVLLAAFFARQCRRAFFSSVVELLAFGALHGPFWIVVLDFQFPEGEGEAMFDENSLVFFRLALNFDKPSGLACLGADDARGLSVEEFGEFFVVVLMRHRLGNHVVAAVCWRVILSGTAVGGPDFEVSAAGIQEFRSGLLVDWVDQKVSSLGPPVAFDVWLECLVNLCKRNIIICQFEEQGDYSWAAGRRDLGFAFAGGDFRGPGSPGGLLSE